MSDCKPFILTLAIGGLLLIGPATALASNYGGCTYNLGKYETQSPICATAAATPKAIHAGGTTSDDSGTPPTPADGGASSSITPTINNGQGLPTTHKTTSKTGQVVGIIALVLAGLWLFFLLWKRHQEGDDRHSTLPHQPRPA